MSKIFNHYSKNFTDSVYDQYKEFGKKFEEDFFKNYNVDSDNHIFEEFDSNPDVLENMVSSILDLHLINWNAKCMKK